VNRVPCNWDLTLIPRQCKIVSIGTEVLRVAQLFCTQLDGVQLPTAPRKNQPGYGILGGNMAKGGYKIGGDTFTRAKRAVRKWAGAKKNTNL